MFFFSVSTYAFLPEKCHGVMNFSVLGEIEVLYK